MTALVTGWLLLLASAASAQTGYPPPPEPASVPPTFDQGRPFDSGQPAAKAAKRASGVAFTGANILRWLVIAAVLVAVGVVVVRLTRRRRASTDA